MFSRILIPLDGSPEAEPALLPAKEIAAKFGSEVVLVEVTPGYGQILAASAAESFGSAGAVDAMMQAEEAAEGLASAYLENVRAIYGTPSWETVLAEGDSADSIIESARTVGADLIVMATHARRGLKRLFIGSVAEDVIRRCGIPVLVVHSDDADD
jgi:nucleotide-binding universal stress UspA family protein